MAVDIAVYNAIKRFYSQEETEEMYRTAFQAYQTRATEVTITSSSMDGASHSGEITGDPLDLLEVCELILVELKEAAEGNLADSMPGTTHVDFSTRFIEP